MSTPQNSEETHKYPYGIIGNCAFLALVSDKASIDWLCFPRFDSSFLFGKLLDEEKGGSFSIVPEDPNFTTTQTYITNTNIIETKFETVDGSFLVVDFAPRFEQQQRTFKPLMLMRKIILLSGSPRIKVICNPTGDYGEIVPDKLFGSNHIRYQGLEQRVRLTTDISLSYISEEEYFVLTDSKYLTLTWGIPLEGGLKETTGNFLKKTIDYWRTWVKNTTTEFFEQEAIIRSALTLKLHQYEDTGAIIAAATTSLPEAPNSTRNWDYRFCWMRDTHYTLKALNDLSHFTELEKYANYIENIALKRESRDSERLNPLYPIVPNKLPEEKILDLNGYKGNKPVRIGNQAYEHIQNDVYGQVMVTLLPLFTDKRLTYNSTPHMRELVMGGLRLIERTMDEPDNGLWEFRGLKQKHCFTFLFHWAGCQAALRIAEEMEDFQMHNLSHELSLESAKRIEECYDKERGVYTQAIGVKHLDASLLQLINMEYLDPNSEKAKRHLMEMEKELKTDEGLFFRYKHADDFGEPETTFLICAFWYVEALARVGRIEEAIETFNNIKGYSNHLGLLSEDVDAHTGSQWGNFPQTYSHVGLVNAAFAISRKTAKPIYLK
ncbi:glycoside hydrolase family 15 protein [Sediminitomix flava]|uniref:GH15 family glucan-1,4-alpha-glucosidase n=1 Tax=Sediminitomix flava TaxID=379075 RepID=A0A315ZAP8_SEDFL|nr:glycoside hydrolase family 15 protein [Sediminitomix flava]PWJ42133.1 GH15 family glucan-1,4-alpha-glucosidase [Sediminitomix flava]